MEMLRLYDHDLIRRRHLVGGMSQRAIAQELGYARNTMSLGVTRRGILRT